MRTGESKGVGTMVRSKFQTVQVQTAAVHLSKNWGSQL